VAAAFVLVLAVGAIPCVAEVHLTVGTLEQGGQYATVQAAVDAVPPYAVNLCGCTF
jgi:pectin methylesterase-like acyl-CoA thioesterase